MGDDDPRVKSYLELFLGDAGQEIVGNALVNIQIDVEVPQFNDDGSPMIDPVTGLQVVIIDQIDDPAAAVAASMSGNGARASFFIDKMTSATATRNGSLAPTDTGYVDHSAFMAPEELKLVIEWLDIGAQYFNDPFDPLAPMN